MALLDEEDTVPILLKSGQVARVPRSSMGAAMQDPLAAPVVTVPASVATGPMPRVPPPVSKLPLGASRVFYRAPDDTTPYFSSENGTQVEGRLRAPTGPEELRKQGYIEADRDAFLEARTRLNPLRPIPDGEPVEGAPAPMADPEDAALDELAAAVEGAGLNRPMPTPTTAPARVTMRPAMARPPTVRPSPAGDTEADVDALASAWDDMQARAAAQAQRTPGAATSTPFARPVASPGRPVGRPEPVSDAIGGDTLQDAQRRAALMRGLGGAGKGISRIGAAIAGVRPEDGASADMVQSADAQVRDYLQRKQQAEADKATAQQAALKDPASAESQRFQALVSRAFGSVYTPEQIQQMTAADAPLVGQYGQMIRTLEDRAAGRAAETASQQAQLTARATEAEKQRAFEAKQGALSRANAREIAGMRQEQAGDKADEAFQRKVSERNVGGFDIDPNNPPTAEGAKKMASAVDAREQIKGSLQRLEDLFNEYGTEMGGGTAQSGMEAELGNITTQLRLFNQMGVPNMSDYTELAKQIPQTAGVGAWFSREGSIRSKFKTLRDQLDRAVASTARAYKFRPTGGSQRVGMRGNLDLEAEDQQALQWARANPNDPRAKQILSMNGG